MIVERTSRVPFTTAEVWAWHARPGALERLVPPWERVQVLRRTGGIEDGATVTLQVGLGPAAVRWVAEHRDVVPGRQFVDVQRQGPFARWVHLHAFEPDPAGGSLLRDRIECSLPAGRVGAALGEGTIRRALESMLRYRHDTVLGDLEAHRGSTPATYAVTGASGLVGSALVPFLTAGGHRVIRLVRPATRRPAPRGPGDAVTDLPWDPAQGILSARELEGVQGVFNLAGASIAGGRWTPARKRELRESRTRGTALLARALATLDRKPAVMVSVSATGIYGDRGDEMLDDQASPGSDFLAVLGQDWERAADAARLAGVRVVHPRLGLVLSPAGGALQRLLPPFRLGLGGPLGHGQQWTSPASIDDVLGMLLYAAHATGLDGAFNAVAPDAVQNHELARTLGRVLHRPAPFRVPAAALRLALGELADTVLLASQRAVPALLATAGFRWRHPTLEGALRHVLGRS